MLNLKVLDDEMDRMKAWSCTEKSDCDILFLYGMRGGFITKESTSDIKNQFRNASFLELDTGHWYVVE
jgi:hypothetical protein